MGTPVYLARPAVRAFSIILAMSQGVCGGNTDGVSDAGDATVAGPCAGVCAATGARAGAHAGTGAGKAAESAGVAVAGCGAACCEAPPGGAAAACAEAPPGYESFLAVLGWSAIILLHCMQPCFFSIQTF